MEIKGETDLIAGIIYLVLQFARIALVCFSVRELSSGKLKSRANLMGKLSLSVPLIFLSYISIGLGAIIISWKSRYLNIELAGYT